MSELPPDESSIAEVDPGRRKAAAHEAHGAQTFAVISASATTPIPLGAGERQFARLAPPTFGTRQKI